MSTNETLNAKLNHLLANYVVEYHKLQSFHWYVSGKDFFQAHAKLEELYDGINESIDGIAELILQAGGTPISSLRELLETASIEERADEFVSSADVFAAVIADFQALLDEVVATKKAADAEDAYLVSAALDNEIAAFSKSLWMMRQAQ